MRCRAWCPIAGGGRSWPTVAVFPVVDNAIVGIDLADTKQMVVVTDHDSKVLARKTFR